MEGGSSREEEEAAAAAPNPFVHQLQLTRLQKVKVSAPRRGGGSGAAMLLPPGGRWPGGKTGGGAWGPTGAPWGACERIARGPGPGARCGAGRGVARARGAVGGEGQRGERQGPGGGPSGTAMRVRRGRGRLGGMDFLEGCPGGGALARLAALAGLGGGGAAAPSASGFRRQNAWGLSSCGSPYLDLARLRGMLGAGAALGVRVKGGALPVGLGVASSAWGGGRARGSGAKLEGGRAS